MLRTFLRELIQGPKAPIEVDGLRIARDLVRGAQHEEAIKLLTTLIEYKPDWVDALVLLGAARRAVGRIKEGLVDLNAANALAPYDASCLYELALSWYALGDNRLALEYCERTRQIAPDFAPIRFLHAQLILGGEHYFTVLQRIHAHLRPRTYIEVGIFRGESLRFAAPITQAIGIDPRPQLTFPPASNHRIFTETSDTFFATHDLDIEFGRLPVELAFIDGMHHFEYALRDFANIERYCARESTILIHDCFPLDRDTAKRDGHPHFWSGDVWRLIVLLKKYREDLAIHTIGTPPTGLGLIRNLDPDSRFLSENHDRLCEEFLALDYAYLEDQKAEKLNLVANEWENIRALLDAP